MLSISSLLKKLKPSRPFKGSVDYWEDRYAGGGNSGNGSYGAVAEYKASVLNKFVQGNQIESVIEFGCGDGNQLKYATYQSYIGLDVSATALAICISQFGNDPSKSFYLYNSGAFCDNKHLFQAQLAMSLDVTYHLIEYEVFHSYLTHLFSAATDYVCIYAWNVEGTARGHVHHRKFSDWVNTNEPHWKLHAINSEIPKPENYCDFYFYKKEKQ